MTGARARVLLVQMPWANLSLPSLGIALLKAILNRAGVGCDALYANLLSVEWLGGWTTYDRLSVELASELVFSPLYYGNDRRETARQLAEEFALSAVNPKATPEYYLSLVDRADEYINHLFTRVDWERYDIVGFSLTFQQTMASLCLARRIKQRFPDKSIVFGGASCDGSMGVEMVRAFPELDYSVVGEADHVIEPIVRAIRMRPADGPWRPDVPGIVYRNEAGEVAFTGPIPPATDLDSLPDPDFEEYFQAVQPHLTADTPRPRVYVEQSRGCWYGEKNACRFCGLSEMKFRSKSPQRALQEITSLASRHRLGDFYMSDNILNFRYFDSFLPEIARLRHQQGYDLTFFYEAKSNVNKRQVQLMAAAGITMVQIGIESFNDHILQLMAKGVSAIQQIQALKHLAEFGIKTVWNILYANPLERPEDYRSMSALIPYLHHLPPPSAGQVSPMVLQRFSRYWQEPDKYGIRRIRPLPIYERIFDSRHVDLGRLAAFFEYDHDDQDSHDLKAARTDFFGVIDEWRSAYHPGSLTYTAGPGWTKITDKRAQRDKSSGEVITLRGLQSEIFQFCDSAKGMREVTKAFSDRASRTSIEGFLGLMTDRRLLYRSENERYLSLPLHVREQFKNGA